MKVLTLIKAKCNVFLWYVQCCSCMRRSKTKILTTRAPPCWIEFNVVTSHRQKRHLEYGLWLLTSMFLRLLISCKSQKNRLRVSRNRFQEALHSRKHFEFDVVTSQRRQYFGFQSSRAATALHVSKKNITFCFNIKVSTFICKREISGFSSPLKILMWSYFYPFSLIKVHAIFRQLLSLLDELWFSFVLLQTTLDFVQWAKLLQNRIVAHFHQNL